MKKAVLNIIGKAGYSVSKNIPNEKKFPDIDKDFWPLFEECKPYTMSSVERLYSLYQSVSYIIQNNISGDFVECGVWRGGNPMFIAKMLMKNKMTGRKIYLYDTFEGMSAPTEKDKDYKGRDAGIMMENTEDKTAIESVWCYASVEDVRANMNRTGYPAGNILFVKGKVEETIPGTMPESVCLLRLDTDWYESTYHELKHLFPLLVSKGILIIDDYGHWAGARQAVDTYFKEQQLHPLLHRIDYTGRVHIKQ